ncbi:DUF4350 domain-containing protein [Kallotenue papyrolyticum]|uniref:DUF4350 domain-containing protein n=1 Tax=Kallotenue papyrolyticum TaxID=1325125 RepID=UPI00047862C8|nr:DUF4350 domain-containing protein [Kallotenue papyrolyticum]
MSRWRELVLIIVLFGVLIGFTIWGPARRQAELVGQRGSTRSTAGDGAYALLRWLEALGYDTQRLEFSDWSVPDAAHALFVLAPRERPFTPEEAAATLAWVRAGGTLILVAAEPATLLHPHPLLEQLRASVEDPDHAAMVSSAPVSQPLLTTPPVEAIRVQSHAVLRFQRDDYVPLLSGPHGPLLAGIQEGRGYVYLSTAIFPFTNQGLRERSNAALVLNLLRRVPAGGLVIFDEYHHGYDTPPSLRVTAFQRGWGWPVLYTLLVVGAYLALSGRRFGRALPLRTEVQQRSSAEYVESLALLLRRADQRAYVAEHFRNELKRRLGRAYGFVPPDDDAAFIRELQRFAAVGDEQLQAIAALLRGLREHPDHARLIALVQRCDALLDERGRLR